MSFLSPPSVRGPSYYFPSTQPNHPLPAPTPSAEAKTNDESPPPIPTVSPLAPKSSLHRIYTTFQHAAQIVNYIRIDPGLPIASVFAALGVVSVVEDPSLMPGFGEIGYGVVGVVCAGGFVRGVLALEDAGKAVDVDVEGIWGEMWRWCRDRVFWDGGGGGGEEGGEVERTMMFSPDGSCSVFLQDALEAQRPTTLPPPQSNSISLQQTPTRPASSVVVLPPFENIPPLDSPPLTRRHEYAYTTSLTQLSPYHPTSCRRTDQNTSHVLNEHPSGLLGPSPMPSRHIDPQEWKNFTGMGLYKYQQKLEAVGEWSNLGNSRSFEEVMQRVEDVEGRDKRKTGETGEEESL
jgi:hypothetical protein